MIKAGMDTHQVVARFEAGGRPWRFWTANIAKVFDAGETAGGAYLSWAGAGVPVTDYATRP